MSWLLGLSAAVYTAARTSHDFDEVVVSCAGFHFFKQFLCIAKAGSNGNLYILSLIHIFPGRPTQGCGCGPCRG